MAQQAASQFQPAHFPRHLRARFELQPAAFDLPTWDYIRGLAKMKTRVRLAMAVMMALALGQVRAGHAERMRSLVGAVPLRDTG